MLGAARSRLRRILGRSVKSAALRVATAVSLATW